MSVNDDIRTMSLREKWDLLITEVDSNDPIYEKARWGIQIKADIYYEFNGHITIKPKTGEVFIRGKSFSYEDWNSELELRNKIITKALLEMFDAPSVKSPRGFIDDDEEVEDKE